MRHGGRLRNPTLAWDMLVTLLVGVAIAGPELFTKNGFMVDFTNHLWLVWVQEHAISHHHLPTYFVSAPSVGVFYPFFMFYGGTLYALAGALAFLLGGDAIVAYVVVCLLAIWAAYGGALWLARELGARGWAAHAPAIAFVGSAYYVTNLYGRGAWPEFVATSMLPLLIASGLALLRARRMGLWSCALFELAVVVFVGSHNITLLLGSLALLLTALGMVAALGTGWLPPARRILALAGLVLLGVALNAWFLLPDVLHGSATVVGGQPAYSWAATSEFNTFGTLFDPLRTVPSQSTTPALFVQAPDWFILWCLLAVPLCWRAATSGLRRAGLVLVALAGLVIAVIMIGPVWDSLPKLIREAQFPYRMNTYLALYVSGVVLVCTLALQRLPSGRRARVGAASLVTAMAITAALCGWQLWVPNTDGPGAYRNRADALASIHETPRTWYDSGDYFDTSAPVVSTGRAANIDPSQISGSEVKITQSVPAGSGPFALNMGAGSYAVRVGGGLRRVGRTASGLAVVRRTGARSGPVTIQLGPARGSVRAGQRISELAILVLVSWWLGIVAFRRAAARRRPTVEVR